MDEQRQNDQLEPIYNSYVLIQDIALLGVMDDREGCRERVKEIRDMMMMMMMIFDIRLINWS